MRIGFVAFLTLFSHLFVPLGFILQLSRTAPHDLSAWIASLYAAAGCITFIFLVGAWSWFGMATRYALPLLLACAAVAGFPQNHPEMNAAQLLGAEPVIAILVGTFFFAASIRAFPRRRAPGAALDLAFPLRGGTFIIAQGGWAHLLNIHTAHPSQRYALDILMLNAFGIRARGLYPAEPSRYAIYGAEVVSPVDGVVAAAVDGFADLQPPDRDPVNRAGNFVAIESGGATIYLAHLMNGSVRVSPGRKISRGEPVGRVGNSGNTTEPHLHIHAEEGAYPGHFSGNRGLPVTFNGRILVRNDRVISPAVGRAA